MIEAIDEFWSWFGANAAAMTNACRENQSQFLDAEITPRIRRIADGLGWEIGPYAYPDEALVFSPPTYDELSIVRTIVSRAPEIPGWKFFACKPPKDLLSLTFDLGGKRIVADLWTYRLTAYNNYEFVDIEIFYPQSVAIPAGMEASLAELIVEALVGEEMRLEKVGEIEIKKVQFPERTENASQIWTLGPQMNDIFASERRDGNQLH
jgi:hypothetical protein